MLSLLRRALTQVPLATECVGAVRSLRAGKSHKGARARFRVCDKNDKLIYRMNAGKNHFNLHKTSQRLKRLRKLSVVSRADYPRIMGLLRN